jgi:peptide/nickel transport system permease protein
LLRAIWRQPLGAAALTVLVALGVLAALAPAIAPHDPVAQDIPNRILPPGPEHWFGTDRFGRDVFSRVLYGARISLLVGGASVLIGTAAGVALGMCAGYRGGWVDALLQRLTDVVLAFPVLVLALVAVTALRPSLVTITAVLAVALAAQMSRLCRVQAMVVRKEDYVTAARSLGAHPVRIVLRHVLPNGFTAALVHATGFFETAIVTEVSLSFLGLGMPPPDPSWGRMLAEAAHGFLEAAPWLAVFPAAAVALTVFSFTFLGDALRDLLDPRG